VGATAAVGSLVGGVASRWLPGSMLLAVFAAKASLGVALMWVAPRAQDDRSPMADMAPFHRPLALLTGGGVGLGAGLVGAGGAFLRVPLLITVIGIPTRITIGSSLAITRWTATAVLLGKLVTGQIPRPARCAARPGCRPWGASRRVDQSAFRGAKPEGPSDRTHHVGGGVGLDPCAFPLVGHPDFASMVLPRPGLFEVRGSARLSYLASSLRIMLARNRSALGPQVCWGPSRR
jgi:hypothetical protein